MFLCVYQQAVARSCVTVCYLVVYSGYSKPLFRSDERLGKGR